MNQCACPHLAPFFSRRYSFYSCICIVMYGGGLGSSLPDFVHFAHLPPFSFGILFPRFSSPSIFALVSFGDASPPLIGCWVCFSSRCSGGVFLFLRVWHGGLPHLTPSQPMPAFYRRRSLFRFFALGGFCTSLFARELGLRSLDVFFPVAFLLGCFASRAFACLSAPCGPSVLPLFNLRLGDFWPFLVLDFLGHLALFFDSSP